MTFTAADLLRWQFGVAHRMLGARDACAGCAHAVLAEDVVVAGVLGGGRPLALSTWAGRTGLSELPPPGAADGWSGWARRVRVDAATFRPYAGAVHAATDAYLAGLGDGDLDPSGGDAPVSVLNGLLMNLLGAARPVR